MVRLIYSCSYHHLFLWRVFSEDNFLLKGGNNLCPDEEAQDWLGVNVQSRIQNDFEDRLRYWLEESKSIQIVYPDQQSFIIDRIGSNVRA